MKSWNEFNAEQLELAEQRKRMLLRSREHVGLAFIATLRKDGAPLSHAAIVARELGILAVVGCGNATMLLKTGRRVRVDGGSGTVTIKQDVSQIE